MNYYVKIADDEIHVNFMLLVEFTFQFIMRDALGAQRRNNTIPEKSRIVVYVLSTLSRISYCVL